MAHVAPIHGYRTRHGLPLPEQEAAIVRPLVESLRDAWQDPRSEIWSHRSRIRSPSMTTINLLESSTWDRDAPPHYREFDIEHRRPGPGADPLIASMSLQPAKVSGFGVKL